MENSLLNLEISESIQLRNRDPPRHEALSPSRYSRHATAEIEKSTVFHCGPSGPLPGPSLCP